MRNQKKGDIKMNIILNGYLEEFVKQNHLETLKQDKQFEYFTNYIVLGNFYELGKFEIQSLSTGENAPGIDGIAIIVNNRLCTTEAEIDEMIKLNGYLDVDFYIIQTKLTNDFTWTKFLFQFKIIEKHTSEFKNFIHLAKKIFDNAKYFRNKLPLLKIFYLCTGKWNNNEELQVIIDTNLKEIENLNLFSEIEYFPCDEKKIINYYKNLVSPIEATIQIDQDINLETTESVKSARFTILPYIEFIKLIQDENGNKKSVFDGNIRGYLETLENPVNQSMKDTLNSLDSSKFCLLNNGITIVTKKLTISGRNYTLNNYQIVNGCQTSNVIYECRNSSFINKVSIPVKIIETEDEIIQTQITRATNNQTPVERMQLEALTDYQKELEQFYSAKRGDDNTGLFYERLTNQYRGMSIGNLQIVNIEDQMKAFECMFLDKPHLVAGNFGRIIKTLGIEIFNQNHLKDPYYVCAVCYKKYCELFNQGKADVRLWRFRYHILMIIKYLITKKPLPTVFNGKDIIEYSNLIIKSIENNTFENEIKKAELFILGIPAIDINHRKSPETKKVVDLLKNEIKKQIFGWKI